MNFVYRLLCELNLFLELFQFIYMCAYFDMCAYFCLFWSQDREWTPKGGRILRHGTASSRKWSFRHLVQARSSIFQKHVSEGHVPRAQFKNSHCGCRTKNGTFVKPGRCPNCETSQTLRKSLHGGHCAVVGSAEADHNGSIDAQPAIQHAPEFP